MFIFNLNDDLYENSIQLNFIKFIRDEKKFLDEAELINQLKKDEIKCKEILNKEEK